MPYKQIEQQREHIKKWKKDNKKLVAQQQKRYKNKRYIEYANKLILLSESESITYLSSMHGRTRNIVLKYLPDDIQIKYKNIFDMILKNRSKQNVKNATKKRQDIKRDILKQYKQSHPCTHCGEDNYLKLSFHHLDEKTKLYPGKGIDRVMQKCSIEKLKKEIQKCIILCHNCHHIFHYNDYKINILSKYKKLWDNRKTKKDLNKLSKIRNKTLMILYKGTLSCTKCNEQKTLTLVLHHVDYRTKKKRISRLETINAINIELAKCICLCRNCHEEYHQTYGKSFSNIQDMEHYLEFKPTLLSADVGNYKEQFYTELKQIQSQSNGTPGILALPPAQNLTQK